MTYLNPLHALGDDTRRTLFENICRQPSSVNQLVAVVDVSQPAVSQHLKVLRQAQLVRVVKDGQHRIYHLDRRGLEELRAYTDKLWDDALVAFAQEAERLANQKNQSETNSNQEKQE